MIVYSNINRCFLIELTMYWLSDRSDLDQKYKYCHPNQVHCILLESAFTSNNFNKVHHDYILNTEPKFQTLQNHWAWKDRHTVNPSVQPMESILSLFKKQIYMGKKRRKKWYI